MTYRDNPDISKNELNNLQNIIQKLQSERVDLVRKVSSLEDENKNLLKEKEVLQKKVEELSKELDQKSYKIKSLENPSSEKEFKIIRMKAFESFHGKNMENPTSKPDENSATHVINNHIQHEWRIHSVNGKFIILCR